MRLLRWLDENFEKYLLIASLVFIVLLIFLQVVLRYVFDSSLAWAEELARYVMLYQIWIGAAFAVKSDAHIRVTILPDRLKGKSRIKFEIILIAIWMVFAAFMTIKSGQLTNILLQRGQLSTAMLIPMGYAYASVPIGCGLMVIRLAQKLLIELKKLEEGVN